MMNKIFSLIAIGAACLVFEAAAAPTAEQTKYAQITQLNLLNQWDSAVQLSKSARKSGVDVQNVRPQAKTDLADLSKQIEAQLLDNPANTSKSRKARGTTMTFTFEIDDILAYFLGDSWKRKKKD